MEQKGHYYRFWAMLICVVTGVVLLVYPYRPFTASAQGVRQAPPRGGNYYRNFLHDKNHVRGNARDANCVECHRVPTDFYLKDDPGAYRVRDYPDHEDCVRCHRQQFFRGAQPVICSVCHSVVSPRSSARFDFPKARTDANTEFPGKFPHGLHQDLLARRAPRDTDNNSGMNIVQVSLSWQDPQKPPRRSDCAECHGYYSSNDEAKWLKLVKVGPEDRPSAANIYPFGFRPEPDKVKVKNPDGSETVLPPLNTFRLIPDGRRGHKTCFECHASSAGGWNSPYPQANDCVGCHGLGTSLQKYDRIAGRASPRAKSLGAGLPPRISFKFQHGDSNHELECTVCHINITDENTLRLGNPDVPLSSCSYCHANNVNGKTPSLGIRESLEMWEKAADETGKTAACVGCHTADVARRPPPPSHYYLIGRPVPTPK